MTAGNFIMITSGNDLTLQVRLKSEHYTQLINTFKIVHYYYIERCDLLRGEKKQTS